MEPLVTLLLVAPLVATESLWGVFFAALFLRRFVPEGALMKDGRVVDVHAGGGR